MFELATNRIRLGGNRCSTFLLFTGIHILSDQSISLGYSQLDGVPGQVGWDAGEPLVGAVYGGAAAHAGLGAAVGPGHQHQHQQAAEAGLHGEAGVTGSHLQVSAPVTGHMVTVLAMVTTGAHMVSLGVGVRCHASLLTAASRLSLYRAGRQRGAGAGVRSAATRPVSSRAQVDVWAGPGAAAAVMQTCHQISCAECGLGDKGEEEPVLCVVCCVVCCVLCCVVTSL